MDTYLVRLVHAAIKVTNDTLLQSATRDKINFYIRPHLQPHLRLHYPHHDYYIDLMREKIGPMNMDAMAEILEQNLKFSIGNCLEFALLCGLLLYISCLTYPIPLPKIVNIQIGRLVPGDHVFCVVTELPKYPQNQFEAPIIIVDPWNPDPLYRIIELNSFINYVQRTTQNGFFESSSEVQIIANLKDLKTSNFEKCVHILEKYTLLHKLEQEIQKNEGPIYPIDPGRAIFAHNQLSR